MPRPCTGGSSLICGFVPRQDRPRNLTAGINALVGVGSRISTCCRVHSDIPTHAARAPGPSPRPTRSKAGDVRFRVPGSALPRPGKKLGRRRRPFFLPINYNVREAPARASRPRDGLREYVSALGDEAQIPHGPAVRETSVAKLAAALAPPQSDYLGSVPVNTIFGNKARTQSLRQRTLRTNIVCAMPEQENLATCTKLQPRPTLRPRQHFCSKRLDVAVQKLQWPAFRRNFWYGDRREHARDNAQAFGRKRSSEPRVQYRFCKIQQHSMCGSWYTCPLLFRRGTNVKA